ncbi:PAAR-like domain-containing protein [uncultured Methylobacterium sp.]|uniref:PAAR-like domain-containing protein n=1 Tax=uncultured Methylobacterium sp. TaxID=157278 RepID=UPI00338EA68F|nr:DUF4150 domain-containing protein [Methylobacterium sp.]
MSLPREARARFARGSSSRRRWTGAARRPRSCPTRSTRTTRVEGASIADSVRQTDERSHVRGSLIRQCYGDEPGVGGGVTSGTRGAECEPKTWSSSVRAEGRPMVRHDDEWWMNHRNTYGRLTCVKDATSYETPDTKPITPRMERASSRNGDVRQNEASGEKSITSQLAFQSPICPRVMPRLPGLGPRVGPQPVPRVTPRDWHRGQDRNLALNHSRAHHDLIPAFEFPDADPNSYALIQENMTR